MDGRPTGFEVIILKQVEAGSPLPGGNVVKADYESYPGAQAFGRIAWFFSSLKGAEYKFNEVVKNQQSTIIVNKASNIVKADKGNTLMMLTNFNVNNIGNIVKASKADNNQTIPSGEFTQAQFATINSLPLRGVVYNVIQTLVNKGLIKVSQRVKTGAGRPTCFYIKV